MHSVKISPLRIVQCNKFMRMFSEGDGCNCYIHATETFTHFAPELVMIADDFLIAHKENER